MIIFEDVFALTNIDGSKKVSGEISTSEFNNQVEYEFDADEEQEHWFWSLPKRFLGNQINSYGGNLTYTIKSQGYGTGENRIVIIGNGISLTYIGENHDVENYMVPLIETQWSDERAGPGYPVTRDTLLKVLSDITAIRVSASHYAVTYSSKISDIILDTAVDHPTGEGVINSIEKCRCPPGFAGSHCERCETLFYRDLYDRSGVPPCKACPCNPRNTDSCELDTRARVVCHCRPGYVGDSCDYPEGVGE